MKLIYLLSGAVASFDADEVRDRLRRAGAQGLQVNLDDEPVAAAMRFGVTDPPFTAAVSVSGDALDVDAVTAVITAQADSATSVHGWSVLEHRRLDPPSAPQGERAQALANIAVLRRPAELDHATWLERWMVEHTGVAIRTQASFGYIQNVVTGAVTADAPTVDGIVEELFEMAGITDPHAFYGSGGDDVELDRRVGDLMASVTRIGADRDLDLIPTSRYVWDLS